MMARFTGFEQGTPCWIELSTSDLQAAKDFYGELWGWTFEDGRSSPEAPVYSLASLEGADGPGKVAGLTSTSGEGDASTWGVYLAADSVDEAVEQARNAGGQVLVEPLDVTGAGRLVWLVDSSGAPVGLWEGRELIGTELANQPGTAIWNELVVPDSREAAGFYEQVLGLTFDTQQWPGMGSYTTVQLPGGRSVAGSCPPSQDGLPPHWNVYFNVESADDTAARVTDLGGEAVLEPMDIPGVGRMATFTDPTGAQFHVMQNPPEE